MCSFLETKSDCLYSFSPVVPWSDKNIVQGASTTAWACVAPRVRDDDMRGAYLVDCFPAQPLTPEGRDEDGSQSRGLQKVTRAMLEKVTGKKLV